MKKRRLPPLTAIRAFDAVARHASFKYAADEIGVTATAISHQIRLLEEALAHRLFERSAKAVTLTPAGKRLYQASGTIFSALRDAVEEITASQPPQALTLSSTSNFLTNWLVPRLDQLHRSHPALELRLHSGIALVDLDGGQADCAIRYSEQADPRLDSTLLYEDTFLLVSSPRLGIRHPAEVARMTLLHIDDRRVPSPAPDWAHWKTRYGPDDLDTRAGIWFDDEMHAIQAAIAGHGILIASELLVADALAKQLLCAPLPGRLPGGNYYFVTSKEKAEREDVKTFRTWIVNAFRGMKA